MPATVMAEAATLAHDPELLDAFLSAAIDQEMGRRAGTDVAGLRAAAEEFQAGLEAARRGVLLETPAPAAKPKRRVRKSAQPATADEPPRNEELARQALAAGAPDPEGEQAAAEPLSEAAAATLANLRAAAAANPSLARVIDDQDAQDAADETVDEIESAEQQGES